MFPAPTHCEALLRNKPRDGDGDDERARARVDRREGGGAGANLGQGARARPLPDPVRRTAWAAPRRRGERRRSPSFPPRCCTVLHKRGEGEGTLSEIRFGEYRAALRSSSVVDVPSATRSILRVGVREGCVIASLSLFVTTWSTDGQAEEKGSFAPLLRQKENCTMLVRPSVRSAARRAQKFRPIPLAAVSQIYLNRHGVTQRWLGASFETLPEHF